MLSSAVLLTSCAVHRNELAPEVKVMRATDRIWLRHVSPCGQMTLMLHAPRLTPAAASPSPKKP